MQKNRIKIIAFTIILFIPIFDIAFNIGLKEIKLFPLNNGINFLDYNEDEIDVDSLKSSINTYVDSKNLLNIEYRMKGHPNSMYTGVYFYKNDSSKTKFFNLKRVNKVFINLNTSHGKRIPILFLCDYIINKNGKDTLVSRPFETYIDYSQLNQKYSIDLSEFKTPNWWFAENGINEIEMGDIILHKISSINIENCQIISTGIDDKIIISEFKLYSDNTNLFIRDILFLLITIPLTVYIFSILKKRMVFVAYEPTETKQNNNKNLNLEILNFIATNYQNPDFSLEWASKELKISTLQLSKVIKEKYQLPFKKYLNDIRINEVKRLLKESDLSISEIAYQVGYKNISHFNRIFKAEISISPKEYRIKYQEN